MKRNPDKEDYIPVDNLKRLTIIKENWFDQLLPWNWFTQFQPNESSATLSAASQPRCEDEELIEQCSTDILRNDIVINSELLIDVIPPDDGNNIRDKSTEVIEDKSMHTTSQSPGHKLKNQQLRRYMKDSLSGASTFATPQVKRPTPKLETPKTDLYSTPFKSSIFQKVVSELSNSPYTPQSNFTSTSNTSNFSSVFAIPNQRIRHNLHKHRLGSIQKKQLKSQTNSMWKVKKLYVPNLKRMTSKGYTGSESELNGLKNYLENVMKETDSTYSTSLPVKGDILTTKRTEIEYPKIDELSWMQELRDKISGILKNNPSKDIDLIATKVDQTSFTEIVYKEKEIDDQVAFTNIEIAGIKRLKAPIKNLFPALSKSDLKSVAQSFVGEGTVVEKFSVPLQKRDFRTLQGSSWLNDEIINFYGELCMDRAKANPKIYAPIHIFNTFFYEKYKSKGYSAIRRWSKKVDLFTKDYIIIPIHMGMHWCCSIIDFKRKMFIYYDSLHGTNNRCLKLLREYLELESQDKRKAKFDTSDWTDYTPKNIPAQENGYDCGVFTCMFMEFTAREEEFVFAQKHMPYIRQRIASELIKLSLLA